MNPALVDFLEKAVACVVVFGASLAAVVAIILYSRGDIDHDA